MTSLEASLAPPAVVDLLYQNYDAMVAHQVLAPRHAYLMDGFGGQIPYSRVGVGNGPQVMYVHGFSENLVGRMPFAAEMGQRGFDFMMAGENRSDLPAYLQGRPDRATTAQALNNLAVMETAGLEDGAAIVTHSYGSLVFQKMLDLVETESHNPFEQSPVVMVAPAGMIVKESPLRLTRRAFRSLRQEKTVAGQDYPEMFPIAGASSRATQLENPGRSLRECLREIPNLRLDYKKVIQKVGQLTIALYPEDILFPYQLMAPMLQDAMQAGAAIVMPWQLEKRDGSLRSYGGEGSTHDDEIFNAARTAGMIQSVLMPHVETALKRPVPIEETESQRVALLAA